MQVSKVLCRLVSHCLLVCPSVAAPRIAAAAPHHRLPFCSCVDSTVDCDRCMRLLPDWCGCDQFIRSRLDCTSTRSSSSADPPHEQTSVGVWWLGERATHNRLLRETARAIAHRSAIDGTERLPTALRLRASPQLIDRSTHGGFGNLQNQRLSIDCPLFILRSDASTTSRRLREHHHTAPPLHGWLRMFACITFVLRHTPSTH